jgi:hypothetical protein
VLGDGGGVRFSRARALSASLAAWDLARSSHRQGPTGARLGALGGGGWLRPGPSPAGSRASSARSRQALLSPCLFASLSHSRDNPGVRGMSPRPRASTSPTSNEARPSPALPSLSSERQAAARSRGLPKRREKRASRSPSFRTCSVAARRSIVLELCPPSSPCTKKKART